MKFLLNRNYLLVVLLQLWLSVHLTLSSSISGKELLPPIPRWQESWTASQAHGTAMAMVVGDSVVLFLRSPSTDVYKPKITTGETTQLDGLEVHTIDLQELSTRYAPSWFPVGSHTVCVMTGLALDVEHVCRVLQKQVDDYFFVYQQSVTTHKMTQQLAKLLQTECLSKAGRPFGVQCLLMGCDDVNGDVCIYSMDPTGTWQSWGAATVIGKYATSARKLLAKKLQSSAITKLETAIECLATSWKETCKEMGIDNTEEEDCEVLVLRKDNSRTSSLFRVSDDQVERILKKMDATISAN